MCPLQIEGPVRYLLEALRPRIREESLQTLFMVFKGHMDHVKKWTIKSLVSPMNCRGSSNSSSDRALDYKLARVSAIRVCGLPGCEHARLGPRAQRS